ncbi:MAG: hypothetical protein HY810_10795 [Candidatus Omnitrophica bacterium]|nr:hypothetical protein [Candidatus Omnitrophota bacterium]
MKAYNKKQNSIIRFEIEFYEKLLADNPDFIDVLTPLAEAYTRSGAFRKGLEIDQRLARLKPADPIVHYNLACSYSLTGEIDKGIESLNTAVRLGYNEFGYMQADADLAQLRKDQRYQEMFHGWIIKKESK